MLERVEAHAPLVLEAAPTEGDRRSIMRLAGLSKTGIIAASALAFSLVVGAANAGKMYWPSSDNQIHREGEVLFQDVTR